MGTESRIERSRGAVLVLLLVAAGLLVARFLPSGSGTGHEAPDVDADLPTYRDEEAAAHVGELARVCGTVESASWVRSVEGRPTFLNLGRPYPDPSFTVVIWEEHRPRFRTPERRYAGRRICVAGRIRTHEGTPRIEARSPAQIAIRPGGGR